MRSRAEGADMSDEVFGREYADQYDLLYSDKNYEAECDVLEEVFRRYGDGNVRTVLDLGCGTGNHAIPLARRGYRVIGVDRSDEMLAHAREKVSAIQLAEGSVMPIFVHGDVRSVELAQQFDAVLMMFAVLSYHLTNDDVLAALRSVRRHLRPGGLFVCDVWYGPAVLAIRPGDRVKVIPTADGQLIRVASSRLDLRHHLCEVNYQLWRLNGNQVLSTTSERHCMRYFFPLELDFYIRLAGMSLSVLLAFPQIEEEAGQRSWNILAISQAMEHLDKNQSR
jgi:SAM-dependent methyltransferase